MNDSNNKSFNNENSNLSQQTNNSTGVNLNQQPTVNPNQPTVQTQPDILQMYSTTMSGSSQNTVRTSTNSLNSTSKMSLDSLLAPETSINTNEVKQPTDDELLQAFIGKNYEKITKRPFNFAAFFFTSFYLFYRKMFGYGILVFLLNVAITTAFNKFYFTLILNIIVGFLVNKIYLSTAKKRVAVIKVSNPKKDGEELKKICANKGGTSVGKIILGIITEIFLSIAILFIMSLIGLGSAFGELLNFNNWKEIINDNLPIGTGTLLEDVSVEGYGCMNSKCNVSIATATGETETYSLKINDSDFFNKLGDYKDYIKLNIYYVANKDTKTIVDYKIYLKSTNEEITDVKNENDLRDKIGLYSVGTHTDTFTLTEIGEPGFGFKDNNSYTYTDYKFTNSKGTEFEMKYINDSNSSNLVEGNNYTVTFEVSEDTFGYDFTIKSVE